jgi:nucleotide-binding universal stress UspA family protein
MKILIAIDGSEYSKKAVEESCRILAYAANSEIKVLSIFTSLYPMPVAPFVVPENYSEQFDREAEDEARKIVQEATRMIHKRCPQTFLTSEVEKLSGGTVGHKIIEKTKAWKADLIVVGSHGRGFWSRLTMGSTSDVVVHHAPCPVLVVH